MVWDVVQHNLMYSVDKSSSITTNMLWAFMLGGTRCAELGGAGLRHADGKRRALDRVSKLLRLWRLPARGTKVIRWPRKAV